MAIQRRIDIAYPTSRVILIDVIDKQLAKPLADDPSDNTPQDNISPDGEVKDSNVDHTTELGSIPDSTMVSQTPEPGNYDCPTAKQSTPSDDDVVELFQNNTTKRAERSLKRSRDKFEARTLAAKGGNEKPPKRKYRKIEENV